MRTTLCALLSTLCLAAACGDDGSDATPAVDAGPDAPPVPMLAVTATPTTVAAGGSVTLAVSVENFEIVDPRTMSGVMPGKGHFHYQLDTAAMYTAAWNAQVVAPIPAATPPGPHVINVWLVNDNHVDIEPPTYATVTITVQ